MVLPNDGRYIRTLEMVRFFYKKAMALLGGRCFGYSNGSEPAASGESWTRDNSWSRLRPIRSGSPP